MEICPNCGVRFKRYIFKECPGCGLTKDEITERRFSYLDAFRDAALRAQRDLSGLAHGGNPYCNPYGSPLGGIFGGLAQGLPPRCPTCGK